jgi:rRNA maturation endonuclease Nob1
MTDASGQWDVKCFQCQRTFGSDEVSAVGGECPECGSAALIYAGD